MTDTASPEASRPNDPSPQVKDADEADLLVLPATLDVAAIGALQADAAEWLSDRMSDAPGTIRLEDPENVLSLQIAVATQREAQACGRDVQLENAASFPFTLRMNAAVEGCL